MPDQIRQQHNDYWQAVTDVAENILAELEDTDDEDRDEALSRLIHESTDQHDYVIHDEFQIVTLQQSQHPCAALFNGTLVGHSYKPGDNFPFASFAADAFEMDVTHKATSQTTINGDKHVGTKRNHGRDPNVDQALDRPAGSHCPGRRSTRCRANGWQNV